jgi:hypothetical protein
MENIKQYLLFLSKPKEIKILDFGNTTTIDILKYIAVDHPRLLFTIVINT